ncbi:MAG: hypothetical protein E7282_09925 [Lachnospiraceae bacterium]|nr:hypothetical protein [Lachnospiraceae bacterium]
MELNLIETGIELVGTTIKNISVENNIVDVEREARRNFGLNINEPYFEKVKEGYFSQMTIDFEVEIEQSEEQKFKLELSLEGAFLSSDGIEEDNFKQLVGVNGAAALIGIARGKVESITANIFNNGKIVIPFVNVIDYYKGISEEK